jgi:hypothetical protein
MYAVEWIHMLVSFAATEDMALHTIDFTHALTNASQPNPPHLYCERPELPGDLKGKVCGGGKHDFIVGRLNRNLDGALLHQRTKCF